jgi:hypothetical protein
MSNSENNHLQAMNRMREIGRQQLLRMRIAAKSNACIEVGVISATAKAELSHQTLRSQ